MEPSSILGQPHRRHVCILSWNVNGVYTKLEKENVLELLLKFDTVALNEVKTNLRVSLPGFVAYRGERMARHIGGTTVFVHKSFQKCVTDIYTSVQDQVWL